MITQINQFYLEMTTKCNLQCSYCYNHTITRQNGQKLVEKLEWFLHQYSSIISPDLKVTLHGGEVLLFLDEIKAIWQIVIKYIPNASFNIQTNGLNLHLPEVQALLSMMERKFLAIGLDSTFKQLRKLNPWTIRFLQNYENASYNYLIIDKEDVMNLAKNINKIHTTFGKFPTINYNFMKSHELSDLYKDIRRQISKTQYFPNEINVDISIASCGEVVLQNDGDFRGCQSKIFAHSIISLDDAQNFCNHTCFLCEYKKYCLPCPIRIANYQGNLCYLTKALVDGSYQK